MTFSSVTILFTVTAFAMRFIKRIRKQPCEEGSLKSCELKEAEQMWLKYVQRKHFANEVSNILEGKSSNLQRQLGLYMDHEGLLRSRGRLENSDLSEGARCPILLPKADKLTQLIVERTHKESFHSGLSQTLAHTRYKYWIPQGRATVRSILRYCTVCRRYEGGPLSDATNGTTTKLKSTRVVSVFENRTGFILDHSSFKRLR